MKITVISSKKKQHFCWESFYGQLSRIKRVRDDRRELGMSRWQIYANAKMSFSIDYFFKCYYKLVKAKKKKFNVCIKKKIYFHLECTNTHTSTASRVIWNHAFFSLFIAMCAWSCWLWRNGMSRKIKISITFKIFSSPIFFSRSCNMKEKQNYVQ
jgi:hypothetical protein